MISNLKLTRNLIFSVGLPPHSSQDVFHPFSSPALHDTFLPAVSRWARLLLNRKQEPLGDNLLYLLHPKKYLRLYPFVLRASCPPPPHSLTPPLGLHIHPVPTLQGHAASIRRPLLKAHLSYNQFTIHRIFSSSLYHPPPCTLGVPTLSSFFPSQPGWDPCWQWLSASLLPPAICLLSVPLLMLLSPRLLIITLLLNSEEILKCYSYMTSLWHGRWVTCWVFISWILHTLVLPSICLFFCLFPTWWYSPGPRFCSFTLLSLKHFPGWAYPHPCA